MKICLAGNMASCVLDYIDNLQKKELNILQSFIDYKNCTEANERIFNIIKNKSKFFLFDSGAFSMLYGKKKKFDIESYVDKYIDFVKKFEIQNYIELDLYNIIGIDKTETIRKKLEKKIGYKTIPVFHKKCGLDYYKNLTKEYDYIAIGGIAIAGRNSFNVSVFSTLNKIARDNNCKVHGLGYTAMKDLEKTGFYSVDSTSWLSPLRYGGSIDVFNGTTIKKIKPNKKSRIKKKIRVHQFSEWIKFQKYAERY